MSLVSTGFISPRVNTMILEHGELFVDAYPWVSLAVFLQSTVGDEQFVGDLLNEPTWLTVLADGDTGFRA